MRTKFVFVTGGVLSSLGKGLAAASLGAKKTAYGEGLELNEWDEITSYNNFYEFGTDKGDPARFAHALTTEPWTVEIDGLVGCESLAHGTDAGSGDVLAVYQAALFGSEELYLFKGRMGARYQTPWLNRMRDMVVRFRRR